MNEPRDDNAGDSKDQSSASKGSEPLSRRNLLTGLASIGTLGAFSGAGATALLSDSSLFTNNFLRSGQVDLKLAWTEYYDPAEGSGFNEEIGNCNAPSPDNSDFVNTSSAVIRLGDIQPGDTGGILSCLRLYGNPACVWMRVLGGSYDDNGLTLPEAQAGDVTPGNGQGELQDYLNLSLWYDSNENGCLDPGECEIGSGTLEEVVNPLESGILLDADAFQGDCRSCRRLFKYNLNPNVLEDTEDLTVEQSDGVFTFYDGDELITKLKLDFYDDDDDGPRKMDFDVLEGAGICQVDVKGAGGPQSTQPQGINTYEYACSRGAEGLHAPLMDHPTKQPFLPAISHVVFHYCPEEPECLDTSTNYCLGLEWELPEDAPPIVHTDSVEFVVQFVAIQSRHSQKVNPWGNAPDWGNSASTSIQEPIELTLGNDNTETETETEKSTSTETQSQDSSTSSEQSAASSSSSGSGGGGGGGGSSSSDENSSNDENGQGSGFGNDGTGSTSESDGSESEPSGQGSGWGNDSSDSSSEDDGSGSGWGNDSSGSGWGNDQ